MTPDEKLQRLRETMESHPKVDSVVFRDMTLHCGNCGEETEVEYDLLYEMEQHLESCRSAKSAFDPDFELDYDVGVNYVNEVKSIGVDVQVAVDEDGDG